MTITTKQLFACIPILCILAGCGQNSTEAMAECESTAYEKIGVHSDSTATLSWLQDKTESVRVCMLMKGFKYKYVGDWTFLVQEAHTNVYKKYGLNETPYYQIRPEIHKEAQEAMDIFVAKASTYSVNWSK